MMNILYYIFQNQDFIRTNSQPLSFHSFNDSTSLKHGKV